MAEVVMCSDKRDIYPGMFSGFNPMDWWCFTVNTPRIFFADRDLVETNEDVVQWIPYCINHDDEAEERRYLTYHRKGTEGRLHGFRSLGIGGHVSNLDVPIKGAGFCETIATALRRECDEEFPTEADIPQLQGTIYEGTTSVGRVHIGLVFTRRVALYREHNYGEEILLPQWRFHNELLSMEDSFENWSRILIPLLPKFQ